MTSSEDLARPFEVLNWSFGLSIAGTLAFIILAVVGDEVGDVQIGAVVLMLTTAAAGLAFYISLGVLATKLGRSWIVWIGLTFLGGPVGSVLAYAWMRSLVEENQEARREARAP